jgi:hypothetical protein
MTLILRILQQDFLKSKTSMVLSLNYLFFQTELKLKQRLKHQRYVHLSIVHDATFKLLATSEKKHIYCNIWPSSSNNFLSILCSKYQHRLFCNS